ncbi:MAG: hypothetical protein K6E63_00595 [Lachnospiraceae bacterium]|nr:hypothetical protein [Lachnospiraceae bacterium]
MKTDKVYRLGNKEKIIGIFLICLVFVFTAILCMSRKDQNKIIVFAPQEIELKTAKITDGAIRSYAPSDDFVFDTQPFILPSGNYHIDITYSSTAEADVLVQGNNNCTFSIELPVTGGTENTITNDLLILPIGTDKGRLKVYQSSEGELAVNRMAIRSDIRLNRDTEAYIISAAIVALALCIFVLIFNRLKLSKRELSYIVLLVLTLILVNIPYCSRGTRYEVDTQGALKRIEAIVQGIRDGQFPVIIGPNYANQYGEMVILQPSLFLYFPAFLRLLGVSIPVAYNIYMIVVNIATALVTAVSVRRMFGSVKRAVIAAVVYLIEPFRLFVMMNLGAGAGMGTSLVFLPILIVGIYEVIKKKGSSWKFIAIGLWGIVSCHVLSFALSLIVMFVYIIAHIIALKEREVFMALVKAAIMFSVLSIGTLLPFMGFYFTAWNRAALAWTDFYNTGVNWYREMQNVVAFAVTISALVTVYVSGKLDRFARRIFITAFIFLIIGTPFFPWKLFGRLPFIDSFLGMMQYPRRFHIMAVPSVAQAVALAAFCKRRDKDPVHRAAMGVIIFSLLLGVVIDFQQFYVTPKLFHSPQVGEINTLMEDYLPDGTLTEWYKTDTGEFSDYDDVEAYSYSKMYTKIDCSYTSKSEGQYMEFPEFYYEGYYAYDQNGAPLKVEKGNRNRVRVYLTKSDEVQELHLKYRVKTIYTAAFLFSILAGGVWLMIVICKHVYVFAVSRGILNEPHKGGDAG